MGAAALSATGQKSSGTTDSQSQFGQDIWGPQGEALQGLYGQLGGLFGQSTGQMQGDMGGVVDNMNQQSGMANDAWGQQLGGGATADMGLQNQLSNSLQQSANNPSAMQEVNNMIMGGEGNNYADAMRNQYVSDANRASDNLLSNLDSRAAASGMAGGSRHGTAIGRGMEDINRNLQSNMAQTGFNTFDKDLDRKLAIANQADQGNFQRQQLMSNMLGQQNQASQGAIGQGQSMQDMSMSPFAAYMAPWQAAGQLAQGIGGPTTLSSGTSNDSSTSESKGGGAGVAY